MKKALRIAVVMGGPSGEHDISLKSGSGIAQALVRRRFVVEPITIPKELSISRVCKWVHQALTHAAPDVVFIALHGPFGEDGTIQNICEKLHLAYTGSDSKASRLGMDKVASRKRFEASHLAVPRWQTLDMGRSCAASQFLGDWSYPLVVKPISQGSSLGVSIVHNESGFPGALSLAGQYGSTVLVEEFVQGRELTVGILADLPLPVIEVKPRKEFFDFTAKYTPGCTDYIVPALLSDTLVERVQQATLAAHNCLGCRHLSRTDLILTMDEVPVILEVNTIPGFTPTSLLPKAAACVGISYEELCERLVMMAASSAGQDAMLTSQTADVVC